MKVSDFLESHSQQAGTQDLRLGSLILEATIKLLCYGGFKWSILFFSISFLDGEILDFDTVNSPLWHL